MDEVKQHFEGEAGDFDRISVTLVPDYAEMLEALIAALPFEKKRVIHAIDLGCGTGTLARAIVDTVPNASVTCVDVARNMIALAQSQLENRKLNIGLSLAAGLLGGILSHYMHWPQKVRSNPRPSRHP
jgi:tRNA (cmo5U34)-methyltransferase